MDTVAALLAERAGDEHVGLKVEDRAFSWAQIVHEGASRGSLALGVRRDGPFHVGVLLDNVPEYLFWIVGAALAGAAVVGVNSTRRGAELVRDVRHTDCQLLVTDRAHLPLLDGLDVGIGPGSLLVVDEPEYADAVASYAGAAIPDVRVEPGDRLLLLFTSGSTGAPKAVVCSQGRLAGIGGRISEMFAITRGTTTYSAMPLFHGNALMANWAGVLATGATFSMRPRFSASGFLPDVRHFGASFFNYVGRALAYVLATPEQPDDADNPLELGFGTEASARDREEFTRRFACRLIENYGSSEGAIAVGWSPGAPPGSLGRALHGADVAVVDPATGSACPPAEFDDDGRMTNGDEAIGELVGRNVVERFEGYYNNPEADAERLRGGWYWSGDLGFRDADGWLYFAGRSSDWLRVDGENFAAAPVEAVLARFPGVVMVAVYPVADPRTGDAVMAALELAPGTSLDARAFGEFLVSQRDLGTKWAPRFVRVVPAMPLTATNKVQKASLRAGGWSVEDLVLWRPGRELAYRELTADDRRELDRLAAEHGRPTQENQPRLTDAPTPGAPASGAR
ncbi:MAG TPA: AMP-binding protein [Acidimicrobiales bacterium]|nr:AMP-binding protein [Acidimicrobiales bacterium]